MAFCSLADWIDISSPPKNPRNQARPTGLEPATSGSTGQDAVFDAKTLTMTTLRKLVMLGRNVKEGAVLLVIVVLFVGTVLGLVREICLFLWTLFTSFWHLHA